MTDSNRPNGVIDFKKAKSQLSAAKKAREAKEKGDSSFKGLWGKNKFALYLQYFVLLIVVAYMMQLCRS